MGRHIKTIVLALALASCQEKPQPAPEAATAADLSANFAAEPLASSSAADFLEALEGLLKSSGKSIAVEVISEGGRHTYRFERSEDHYGRSYGLSVNYPDLFLRDERVEYDEEELTPELFWERIAAFREAAATTRSEPLVEIAASLMVTNRELAEFLQGLSELGMDSFLLGQTERNRRYQSPPDFPR